MISDKSNHLYRQILTAAYVLNAIPYKVSKPGKKVLQLRISPSLNCYKYTFFGNLIFLVLLGIILTLTILIRHPGSLLIRLSILTALVVIVECFGIQLLLFLGYGSFINIINTLEKMQTDFKKINRVAIEKDGLEKLLPLLNAAVGVLPFLGFPIAVFVIQKIVPDFGFDLGQILAINFVAALVFSIAVAINVSTLVFIMYTTALYANSITLWMDYLKWKPCTLRVQILKQRVFRKIQILNIVVQHICGAGIVFEFLNNIVLQVLLLCFIIMITVKIPLVSIVGLLIVLLCFFITEFCFRKVLEIRKKSIEYPQSFLENQGNLRMVDRLFYQSCTPIEFWVGGLFSVASSSFFLKIYGMLIFKGVCDLLILLRNTG